MTPARSVRSASPVPRHVRHGLLSLMMLTLPLAACAQAPSAAPASLAAPKAPALQLVTGLPDFTGLVEQVSPGVVNVEAKIDPKPASRAQTAGDDDIPDFFRRFFGPDFPGPNGRVPSPGSRGGKSLGSGFVISPDGYVLTNHHVIDGADEVTVKLADRRVLKAKVVGSDKQYDVALLKIDANNLPTVRIGDSSALKPGQWVVAIGSPLGLDHSVTAGIVSALGRSTGADQAYVPFIQTDVPINQGNSGGPLLNTRGEAVGINSQIFSMSGGYMGISFAIPIDLAMNAVEQIKKTGHVSRGQLGVAVQEITPDRAKGFGLPNTGGALVSDVTAGSAAAKAGLQVGDVITSVDGKTVGTSSDLPPLIGTLAPGSKVALGVVRDGKPRTVNAVLDNQRTASAAGDEDDAGASAGPTAPATAETALGLGVADLDAATRRQLGLNAGEGVRITRVAQDLDSDVQLAPGMVILRVGNTPVGSAAELNRLIRGTKPGDVVMLLVRYQSQTSFVAVTAPKR